MEIVFLTKVGGYDMFHKIKGVNALPEYKICVTFAEGIIKIYDVSPLFEKFTFFMPLKESTELFSSVMVDQGGYGVIWNDDIDISNDELWANGETIVTSFELDCLIDALMKEAATDETFISRTSKCDEDFAFVDSEVHFKK